MSGNLWLWVGVGVAAVGVTSLLIIKSSNAVDCSAYENEPAFVTYSLWESDDVTALGNGLEMNACQKFYL